MPFFDSWTSLGNVLLAGLLGYAGLVLFLRVSGKRTLSKMNAFDFVVTIAIGSTLASTILSDSVPIVEGLAALALLIGLQYLITWASVRWEKVEALFKSQPTLIFFDGEFLARPMTKERITTEEVRSAVRANGIARIEEVAAVVLETDGSFTVLQESGHPETTSALADVGGAGDRLETGDEAPPIAQQLTEEKGAPFTLPDQGGSPAS